MNNPLVSVLITSYNRAKYIEFAVESVLNQTFQDYEVIICDNCSTDNTMDILKKYQQHPKVKIYQTKENIGQFPNRNYAASLATGKYLKYVDSDDYMYSTGLQVLVAMMEANPSAGWGLCSLLQIAEKPYPFLLNPNEAYRHNFLGPGLFYKAPLSSIIKKTVFDEVGGFNPGRMVGDYEMWLRLAQTYKVLLMPDGIVWYREHDGQEIVFVNKYLKIYQQIKIHYLTHPKCPLDKNEVKQVFAKENAAYKKNMIKAIFKCNKTMFLENFSSYKLSKNPVYLDYPKH
jgi:glycosyltransferase involved in cell wall biosynthesis